MVSRRQLLGTAVAATVGLAGCTGNNQDQQEPSNGPAGTTRTTTRRTTEEETTTEPETTTTEKPLTGSINAVPTEPDAEWADANVFNTLNGDTRYELDLGKARSRSNDILHWDQEYPGLLQTARNVNDKGYRQEFIERVGDGESFEVDWEVYTSDRPFPERWVESNMNRFHNGVEWDVFGGDSSAYNEPMAAWIQQVETQLLGNDILAFGHQSKRGNHGLVTLLENPTYNEDEFSEQETYWVETDNGKDPAAGELSEQDCPYLRNDQYPTETDWGMDHVYRKVIVNTDNEAPSEGVEILDDMDEQFGEYIKGDQSQESGQYFVDMMAAAQELAHDSRLEGKTVKLEEDAVTVV